MCLMQEKLDQMSAATLPPCDLPSMSAAELLELLEQHKEVWMHKSNQSGLHLMLELARAQGKTFRESNWFKVKKEVIGNIMIQKCM